jgi:hypothetical protein
VKDVRQFDLPELVFFSLHNGFREWRKSFNRADVSELGSLLE